MNTLDYVLIGIIALFVIFGALRGFLKSVLSLASSVVGGLLAKLLSPVSGAFIYNSFLHNGVLSKTEELMAGSSVDVTIQNFIDKALSQFPESIIGTAKQFGFYPDAAAIFPGGTDITPVYVEENLIRPLLTGFSEVVCFVVEFFLFSLFLR